jgi:hypothetical protein
MTTPTALIGDACFRGMLVLSFWRSDFFAHAAPALDFTIGLIRPGGAGSHGCPMRAISAEG